MPVAGGDNVNAADINGLEVTAAVTGTSAVTVASGFTIASVVIRTALRGKLIYLKFDIVSTNAFTSTSGDITDTTIATLLAAYRPTELLNVHFSGGAPSGDLQINADGTMVIRSANVNIAAGANLRGSAMYLIA